RCGWKRNVRGAGRGRHLSLAKRRPMAEGAFGNYSDALRGGLRQWKVCRRRISFEQYGRGRFSLPHGDGLGPANPYRSGTVAAREFRGRTLLRRGENQGHFQFGRWRVMDERGFFWRARRIWRRNIGKRRAVYVLL